jgi:GNAT superfamily N-acetyltransferase
MTITPPSTTSAAIDRAIEVFVHGFSFTRSYTHPYVPQRVGPLWVVRDAPRKNERDYRREEWTAHGVEPREVDRIVRKHTRGRFAVCAFHPTGEDDTAMRAAYKALGYRLGTTEAVMVHALRRIPRCASPATIERVTTAEMAERVAKYAGSRQILPEHLTDSSAAPMRQYVALIGDQLVGRVGSVATPAGAWCSNMHVVPAFRRRGIGRALLCRMLRDDRAGGATFAALTASHAGAMLYPVVGYQRVATLYLYTPGKR